MLATQRKASLTESMRRQLDHNNMFRPNENKTTLTFKSFDFEDHAGEAILKGSGTQARSRGQEIASHRGIRFSPDLP